MDDLNTAPLTGTDTTADAPFPMGNPGPQINPAQPPAPPPAPKQGIWHSALRGMLEGLTGAEGQSHGALGGLISGLSGQEPKLRAQYDQQQQQKLDEGAADIKFKSAQATLMAVDTHLKETQLNNLPQQEQDAHNAASLDEMDKLRGMGITPTAVIENKKGGTEVIAAMKQQTQTQGGVGPNFVLHVGDKLITYDLDQLTQKPQALSAINNARHMSNPGAKEIDASLYAQMSPSERTQMLNTALNYTTPMPSEDNLKAYTSNLATVKEQPDYPGKEKDIKTLTNITTRMKTSLDSAEARTSQIAANAKLAAAPAEAEAAKEKKIAEENTPGGRATLAKTQAEAEQAQTQATLNKQALGRSDDFGNKVGLPGDNVKVIQDKQKSFNKAYVEPLAPLVKSDMEFNRILSAGDKMTPAEKVTGLLQAVGISFDPLKGKGARLNNDIIQEHAGARDIYQGALQKIDTLRPGGGGPITTKQVQDYADIAKGVVHDAYVYNANEAQRQGLPVDFLPKAGKQGEMAPDDIVKIYVDAAKGDTQKAIAALTKAGYK